MPELKYAHEICSKVIVYARVVSSTMQRLVAYTLRIFVIAPTSTSAIRPVYISNFHKQPVVASYIAYALGPHLCGLQVWQTYSIRGCIFRQYTNIFGQTAIVHRHWLFQRDIEYKLLGSPQLLTSNMPK